MNQTDANVVDPGFGPPADTNAGSQNGPADVTSGPSSGDAKPDDASRAPEEESQSQIPGDPRPVNEEQPPTKEQY